MPPHGALNTATLHPIALFLHRAFDGKSFTEGRAMMKKRQQFETKSWAAFRPLSNLRYREM
jgi:hypothetical protein